jgi:hypothetical protein
MPFFAAKPQLESAASVFLRQTFAATFVRDGIDVLKGIFPASISCTKRTTRLLLSSVSDNGLPAVPFHAAPPDFFA